MTQGFKPNRRHFFQVVGVSALGAVAACAPTSSGTTDSSGPGVTSQATTPGTGPSSAPGSVGASTPAPSGGSLPEKITVLQRQSIDGLAPDVTTQRMSLRTSEMIMEPLVRYQWNGTTFDIVPALAESYKQTDPTHWRVKLKSGLKFTNGEPITSQAVASTVDAYFANNKGGGIALQGISIAVVSETEFDIVTKTPNLGSVPDKMAVLWIYPPVYYAKVGADGFSNAPIGAGPYTLQKFEPGLGATLQSNPAYWAGEPPIRTVVIRTVADDSTRVAELAAGTADFITDIPPSLASQVSTISGVSVKEITTLRRVFAFITPTVKPTDDLKVRQAINHAIDKEGIVKSIFGGHATALEGIWLPGEVGYTKSFKGYDYNPEKAKQLLAEAGYANGITVNFHAPINYTVNDHQTAEAIQGMLAEVGITAKLDTGTVADLSPKIRQGVDGLTLFSFAPFYNGPSFMGTVAYWSETASFAQYAPDKDLHKIADAGLGATDPAKAQEIYASMEQKVSDLAYWLPLYGLNDIYAMKNSVSAWNPRPDQNFDFQDIARP